MKINLKLNRYKIKMKKIALGIIISATLLNCSKIEETVNQTVTSAKEKAQQKTSELVHLVCNFSNCSKPGKKLREACAVHMVLRGLMLI